MKIGTRKQWVAPFDLEESPSSLIVSRGTRILICRWAFPAVFFTTCQIEELKSNCALFWAITP